MQWPILSLSSASLALHFAFWVWSLEHTSLVHALLWVSATPLIIAAISWAAQRPISRGEQAGALLGLVGGLVLAHGADGGEQVTLAGDVSSAAACLAVVGYLYCGQHLRTWMPIFIYATAVTGGAAVLLTCAAMGWEHAGLLDTGSKGLLGWATEPHYAWRVMYLAVGPGIVGHTGSMACRLCVAAQCTDT